MHDTSNKNVFEEASWPFSLGCMRVRNARRIAEILQGWDAAKIAELLATGPDNNEVRAHHLLHRLGRREGGAADRARRLRA
jgi:murein L,D-transpeptidase YcbB/YkuD